MEVLVKFCLYQIELINQGQGQLGIYMVLPFLLDHGRKLANNDDNLEGLLPLSIKSRIKIIRQINGTFL